MNEFVEQFLIEARELVEQATADLLALEQSPTDAGRLDSVFRAFHTLKGAAGIVDFDAMGRALHAVENVLSRVRAGNEPVTTKLVGKCLSALDQIVVWLDTMQAEGEPPADGDPAADTIVRQFVIEEAAPEPKMVNWQATLAIAHPDVAATARTAFRYAPTPDSFFNGKDPLAALERMGGIVALMIDPPSPGALLATFDPFACQLVFTAYSTAPAVEIRAALGNEVEVVSIATEGGALEGSARQILEAQADLLSVTGADGVAGRIASAARASIAVLRARGLAGEAALISEALTQAQEGNDPKPLRATILAVLHGAPPIIQPTSSAAPSLETTSRTVRVDIDRIDAFVRLSSELLVAKNAVGHISTLAQNGADPQLIAGRLKEQHGVLDRLIGELQRSVVNIRVLPLRQVFQRFPRLVREMAQSTGKSAKLVVEGDDTEADKAVVERLFEPLLHVLRNAVDHGVETPERRALIGKPEVATIILRAQRRGEYVFVEVEDDGAGIDVERVRQVAAMRGLSDPDELSAMSDDQVVNLIFAPGFSTASQVTDLSGRGVGMDAVRVAIARMGGRVVIENRPGRGAIVRLSLPFTVLMTGLVTVESGGQMFGVPMDSVVETVRLPRDRIIPIGASHAFVLRDRTIPLLDLAHELGRDRAAIDADATVLVVFTSDQTIGLEVDRIGERIDVMLKPMEGLLSGVRGLAGTTLLGDGQVLIVLDPQEMLH